MANRPILDPSKFDEWLHKKFGDYEKDGHSMQSLLSGYYGSEVADQIKELIHPSNILGEPPRKRK